MFTILKLYNYNINKLNSKNKIDEINNINGNTALHEATIANRSSIVKILLRNNPQCDVTIRNHKNESALDIAKRLSHNRIVNLLTSRKYNNKNKKKQDLKSSRFGRGRRNSDYGRQPHSGDDAYDRARAMDSIAAQTEKPRRFVDEGPFSDVATRQGDSDIFGYGGDTHSLKSGYDSEGPNIHLQNSLINEQEKEREKAKEKAKLRNKIVIQGYLEKKKSKAPYNWQERWVMVCAPKIMWSDKKIQDVELSIYLYLY